MLERLEGTRQLGERSLSECRRGVRGAPQNLQVLVWVGSRAGAGESEDEGFRSEPLSVVQMGVAYINRF